MIDEDDLGGTKQMIWSQQHNEMAHLFTSTSKILR